MPDLPHLPHLPQLLPSLPSQFDPLLNPLPDPFAALHHDDDGNGPRTNGERRDADGSRSFGPEGGPGPGASLRDGVPSPPGGAPLGEADPTPGFSPQSGTVGTPSTSNPLPPAPLPNGAQGPALPTPSPTARLDLPLGQIASLANSLGIPLATPEIPSIPQSLRALVDGFAPPNANAQPNGVPFTEGARNGVPFVATPQSAEVLRTTALAFAPAAAPNGTTLVTPPTLPLATQPQLAAQAGERALFPGQFVQGARTPDQAALVQTLRQDAVPLADRMAAQQQAQLAQQAAPLARAEAALAAAAAAAAQVAGTTVAASTTMVAAGNPAAMAAGNPLAVNAGERSGAVSDATLAAAGHTIEGPQRRRMQQSPRRAPRALQWFQLIGRGRDRNRNREPNGQPDSSAVQWLFWLLALVGYAALAFAVVTLVPADGGRHLFEANGVPTRGGLALLVGLGFVLLAWGVARVLRKPAKAV